MCCFILSNARIVYRRKSQTKILLQLHQLVAAVTMQQLVSAVTMQQLVPAVTMQQLVAAVTMQQLVAAVTMQLSNVEKRHAHEFFFSAERNAFAVVVGRDVDLCKAKTMRVFAKKRGYYRPNKTKLGLALLCPTRGPVEGFVRSRLGFRCSKSILHTDNLSLFFLSWTWHFWCKWSSVPFYHVCYHCR